eukprot:TRINITY_DN370_c0_g2_i1.p1 TRINITY_DN370_c0_g2~~TRINITY_DN370_c0_g2_i1.p1  ORF type:complete len:407 (-),score=54.25 TRINITY_DN370_c0_g2_i1:41-1261(-)
MLVQRFISIIFLSIFCSLCYSQCSSSYPGGTTATGFCSSLYFSGLNGPRHIEIVSNNDKLVCESGKSQITVLWEEGGRKLSAKLASASGLNHAVEVDEKNHWLYSSNPTTVFRWRYYVGNRTDLGTAQVVVKNVPCCHHTTRTVRVGPDGLLYVQSGSGSNVDPNSSHSRINRFDITTIPAGGIDWSQGYVFADGLRNEVGIRFDSAGKLWGVENGVDQLSRADLGGDIHNTNPSEELNYFAEPGKFYGYPYCWSEGLTKETWSLGPGTQFVHPNFMNDGIHSDAWCRNPANVVRPAFNFGAHWAPLDILFYYGKQFPSQYTGGAFVSFHGSWNRNPPSGYRVGFVSWENGLPKEFSSFFYHTGVSEVWPNSFRPVGLALGKCATGECLYVTSDSNGDLVEISYRG